MNNIRTLVLIVALLNFAYFVVEFVLGVAIGSVSLFADSVDFFEDAAINMLVFFALAWSARAKRIAGNALAAIILIPAIAALSTAVYKIIYPAVPELLTLTGTAVGALVVNLICAVILLNIRNKKDEHGLVLGAWLAARNDALANILIIVAGLLKLLVPSGWFDIVAGIVISIMNFSASYEVWQAARKPAEPQQIQP